VCEGVLNKIKHYLYSPPLLIHPVLGRHLILYLTVTEAVMRYVQGQYDESRNKERAIYYISKKFTECEFIYTVIEKLYCALVWIIKKIMKLYVASDHVVDFKCGSLEVYL